MLSLLQFTNFWPVLWPQNKHFGEISCQIFCRSLKMGIYALNLVPNMIMFFVFLGVYSELFPRGNIRQLGISVDRTLQVYDQNSIFIISCFMADQHHTALDYNWFSWTGASLLVRSLPSSIQIKGFWFYKQQPGSVTGLTYVMMCEVTCEPENLLHLRQFVYFMKLRQCGYVELYRLRLAV